MGASTERFAVAIDVEKHTDAVGQTVQEVNAATAQITAANQRVATAAAQANATAVGALDREKTAADLAADASRAHAAAVQRAMASITDATLSAAEKRAAAERMVAQATDVGAAAMQKANAAAAADAASKARADGAKREAQIAQEAQAAINQDIALLQLKGRALDVTSEAAVRAWMDEARATREAVAAEGEEERALLNIDLAMKSVTSRVAAMEAAQDRAAKAAQRVNTSIGGIPGDKIRMGAQAASTLAFSLSGVGGSAKTAAFALGNVATVVSMMTNTAKIAAWAAGIGAAVTILGSVVELLERANKEASAPDGFMSRLQNWNVHIAETQLAELRTQAAKLREEIEKGAVQPSLVINTPIASIPLPTSLASKLAGAELDPLKQYQVVLKEIEDTQKRVDELRISESKSLRENARQLQLQATGQLAVARAEVGVRAIELKIAQDRVSTIALGSEKDRAAAREALANREREIRQQFTLHDSTGAVVALTAEQLRQRHALLAVARAEYALQLKIIEAQQQKAEDLRLRAQAAYQAQTTGIRETGLDKQYAVRYAQIIEEGRVAEEQGMRKVDVERRVQAEIRKLQRDTFQQSVGYLGQFSQVLLASKSREVKAVGAAAETMRRVIIGAEGAHSAVLALKEGAAAISSAASGNFEGAALHAASSVQFAAAAALAAQESLGGGRTASAGGGGGAASASTFEPTAASGGGNLTINLITRDPYGRDAIAETVYELQQFGDLKKTIPVAPTRGVRVAGMGG